mmetsp:Transcript_99899/g.158080  ORF Transcript_99899/g.158080 Transcript_99899/m.158080 type:complete len:178 (-) Transcript_99899:58-591(-)|eukprot:CAMPEP_0169129378 /NCGR_PEP_ID=MMETSP1015-20121227/37099_1 /TAXON_ID=342587 /ORGANISM="Karlodinium micrum, Strain CCMP2283" /LENGTH=177 /DNA_ID=CAMNT_0009193403 /DNA_START=52 /DNA_END=585 /DNA_ORIENTATION=-
MAMRQFLVVSLWHSVVRGVDLATNQGIMRHDRASQAVLDHSGKAVIDTATLVALSSKTLEAKAANDPGDNPCSYLGCNSHKCEWASGGRISRVMAGISCSNAVVKGSGPDAATVKANTSVKIELLKDCVDVVRKEQGVSCSTHFQLHKETMTCSCVPIGDVCDEQEEANVCRFVVKD